MRCVFCHYDRAPDGTTRSAAYVVNGYSTCVGHLAVAHVSDPNEHPTIWKENDGEHEEGNDREAEARGADTGL